MPLTEAALEQIKKDAIDTLVKRELFYQTAIKNEIKIDVTAVTEYLQAYKNRFPNEESYKSTLTKMKVDEEILRSQITREMTIKKFIDENVKTDPVITPEQIKEYYTINADKFKTPDQVKASHILLKIDPESDETAKSAKLQKIKGIQEQLKGGADFATLAKENSDCPSSSKGGDLGFFGKGQMVKKFEEAAFSLNTGDSSDIVETRFGYHIIKVTDKKVAGPIEFSEVEEKIKQYLETEEIKKTVEIYVEKLKETAKIEIVE